MVLRHQWGLGSAWAAGEREVPRHHLVVMVGVATPNLYYPLD